MITRTRSYPVDALDPKVKHYSRMNFNLADLEAADVNPEGWPIWSETGGVRPKQSSRRHVRLS